MGEGPEGQGAPGEVVNIQRSFLPDPRTMNPKDTSLMLVLLSAIT